MDRADDAGASGGQDGHRRSRHRGRGYVERGNGHTASIFSRDVDAITRMAREIDVSIFVANCANLAGLGDGGEGYTSFSIATTR